MSARVKVRAAIWVQGKLVVHRSQRRGRERMSLPGGWVGKGESVTDALRREIDEELGIEVEIGDLVCAAEVVNSSSRQDVELVFAAGLREQADADSLTLIDPHEERAGEVLPPILGALADQHDAHDPASPSVRWLGNIYAPGLHHLS